MTPADVAVFEAIIERGIAEAQAEAYRDAAELCRRRINQIPIERPWNTSIATNLICHELAQLASRLHRLADAREDLALAKTTIPTSDE